MRRTISMLSWDLLRLSQIELLGLVRITEISVEAGRNNESREQEPAASAHSDCCNSSLPNASSRHLRSR